MLESIGFKKLTKKTDRVKLRAKGMYYDFGKGIPVKSNVVSSMNADILTTASTKQNYQSKSIKVLKPLYFRTKREFE